MNIFTGLDEFKGNSSLKTWAHRVVLNTCFKHVAKQKHEKHRDDGFDVGEFPSQMSYEAKVDFKIMVEYASNFQHVDRELIYLYLIGENQKHISEVLGLSVTNVSTRLNRLKNQIQTYLNKGLSDA